MILTSSLASPRRRFRSWLTALPATPTLVPVGAREAAQATGCLCSAAALPPLVRGEGVDVPPGFPCDHREALPSRAPPLQNPAVHVPGLPIVLE